MYLLLLYLVINLVIIGSQLQVNMHIQCHVRQDKVAVCFCLTSVPFSLSCSSHSQGHACHLHPYCSKWSWHRQPLWACQKCRSSGSAPDLLNPNLHFDRVPRRCMFTVKCKKSWSLLLRLLANLPQSAPLSPSFLSFWNMVPVTLLSCCLGRAWGFPYSINTLVFSFLLNMDYQAFLTDLWWGLGIC